MSESTETILERLSLQLPSRYTARTGTYTHDILKAHASEFENVHAEIDELEKQSHPSTATGKYLERCVSDVGLVRKSATAASGIVTIYGDTGSTVKAGDKVAAGNVIFNITDNASIGTDGSVTVSVVCDAPGISGNVGCGYINRFPVTLPGIKTVNNAHATTGGSDTETDEELRARWFEFVSHPVTSGNKWQYIAWAKSVDGVGDAKCIPLWNGNGTVKVIIIDSEKQLAPPGLIAKVKEYIDAKEIIGADTTVVSAVEKYIDVSCHLDCDDSSVDDIKENISDYLRNISFSAGYVSPAKIGQVIMNTDGVDDYSSLKINGGTVNIPITEEEIAVLGVVNFD